MYIVNVNNFRPFDLFILLNAAFRNSNIAFSHAALDICLRCAYNALKQTVRQCPSGSYGDAEAAAGYNYKAYFVIPLFICVDGGPQENQRAAVICEKIRRPVSSCHETEILQTTPDRCRAAEIEDAPEYPAQKRLYVHPLPRGSVLQALPPHGPPASEANLHSRIHFFSHCVIS